ncbi:hypothetical protein EV138_6923 [Kribbella voronezhensis]|uniref:Uncharacterized protein n=1 Tax=Kribbella voronezhensis TaxID=2512212 RepID=A0A4R7SYI2_9ACTN|nr:hypothetical protein [Kribbella voronezhensis]TDU84452.1 hypothetical protein EV138_6923 [Kribbella voronezhensis]
MADEVTLEIEIDTTDEATVRAIEQALAEVEPQRWDQTREVVTILTIAASAVALVNALLDLKKRLSKPDTPAPTIVIKNLNRLELNMSEATPETLRELLEDSTS